MAEKRVDWNLKQSLASKIVEQLAESTQDEQKAFILKLLEQVDETFLIALELAYSMTSGQKRGSKES